MSPTDLTEHEIAQKVKSDAAELGFYLCGIAPAARPDTLEFFKDWLKNDYQGKMGYLSRREEAYSHPSGVMPQVKSLILVGMNYFHPASSPVQSGAAGEARTGRIAQYATAEVDYHDLIRSRLKQLSETIRSLAPGCHCRVVVDTAPLLERDFARKAGLGWFGKNTLLINKQRGSFFFLGGILTDLQLAPDVPHQTNHCGTCTRCLEACPTNAFTAPYVLDARKCISYLTIELRGEPIPVELRDGMQDWLFGCDVCQAVCPWNRHSTPSEEAAYSTNYADLPDAAEFLVLSEQEFSEKFSGTALERTGRLNLARNAAIAMGNSRNRDYLPLLERVKSAQEGILYEAATWAINKIESPHSRE